jgi:hypothetical protein
MWGRIRRFCVRLGLACSIERRLMRCYVEPGWRVAAGPPPEPAAPFVDRPDGLPEGVGCQYGLACACGLCLRPEPAQPSFRSRLTDPAAPRAFWP